MSKIIGVTVGTPISVAKVEQDIKPVKTVNGVAPDENGNVDVGGSDNAVTSIDFSNFENGSFTETLESGETITHTVEFDDIGRPSKIDGVTIEWGGWYVGS